MFQGYSLINIKPSVVVLLAINYFCFFFCSQGCPNLSRMLKDSKAMKKQRVMTEVPLQPSKFKILTLKSIEKIWRYCTIIQETLVLTALSAVNKALNNDDTENFNNFKVITCLVFKNNFFICKLLEWGRER